MAPSDKLTIVEADDALVVEGELDAHTATYLDETLAARPDDTEVVLDLGGVRFVDSSGLTVLVATHKRLAAGGGGLVVRSPSRPVRRLLEITGLVGELQLR